MTVTAEDLGLDRSDIRRMVLIDLAPHLPEYMKRSIAYIHSVLTDTFRPKIILVQGVRMDSPSVLSEIASNGYSLHYSPNDSRFDYCNVTAIRKTLDIREQTELRMMTTTNGRMVELAPDCLVDSYYDHGRMVRIYNFESIRGLFFEMHRVTLVDIITKDAYIHKLKDPDYASHGKDHGFMYMGADLHADADHESVQLLTGGLIRQGLCPSGWSDVWAVLHANDHVDGSTERQTAVFDDSIEIPQLVRPRRHTYFFAYGDVFGRAGTPVSIELNGNTTTSDGIPYSDDYGLTTDVWIPPYDRFTTDEDQYDDE
jgi:hypothetical protein